MNRQYIGLHPYAQIILFVLVVAGTFITHNLILLISGYTLILLLLIVSGQLYGHLRTLLVANIPFLVFLYIVYVFIIKNNKWPHGMSGQTYSLVLFFRITILTSTFQYLLNSGADRRMFALKKLGVRGHLLIIILSSFSVWKGLSSRAERIINARLSRGYLKNRSFFNRVKQVPHVLKPLLASTLIQALERAASWKQRDLFTEINQIKTSSIPKVTYARWFNILTILGIGAWFLLVIKPFLL